MNDAGTKRLALIKSLVEEQGADGDKRWLIAQLETAEATCQSLLDQSSHWEAQALEAGQEVERQSMARIAIEEAFMQGRLPLGIPCKPIDDAIARAETAETRCAELEAKCREYEMFCSSIARTYGEGPISNTSESQEESAEVVKDELLDAIAIVSLLKLARGRMQHIIEAATAGMTHAEVRMTQDLVAQIDAAFDSDPEKPQENSRGQWVCMACGKAHTGVCDVMHRIITGEPQEGKEEPK